MRNAKRISYNVTMLIRGNRRWFTVLDTILFYPVVYGLVFAAWLFKKYKIHDGAHTE